MEATATASQFCTAKINNELFLKKEEMIILSETMLGTIALVDKNTLFLIISTLLDKHTFLN